ncbi:MAG: DUF885 domain-containing protein [Clostridia bacterium]|nr:DUF885 domain-containing protein [Clostridia bacterium]
MKRYSKHLICLVAVVMIVVCATFGLSACNFDEAYSKQLNMLADTMAYLMLGDDAYSWNVFSVDPKGSYGYEQDGVSTWYKYKSVANYDVDYDIEQVYSVFEYFDFQLSRIKLARLKGKDVATYHTLKHTIDTYLAYYGSQYSNKFSLISGDYINSQGGYVADFTSAVENYTFRNWDDVNNLKDMIASTSEAFQSYLDFVKDRRDDGHPLYDSTITAMQEYLDDIMEKGDDYYLYEFVNKKIDAVDFLAPEQKGAFKHSYRTAIKTKFMDGVRRLNQGLEEYKGAAEDISKSYLATYGSAGAAYYKWSFENKTGLRNVDFDAILSTLIEYNDLYAEKARAILDLVDAKQETEPELYADFYAYKSGEKKMYGGNNPEGIISYLKNLSYSIVPVLEHMPEIEFKYMDETVAERTKTLAYYLRSPLDQQGSVEHITLNPYYIENAPQNPLLPTLAHEGYPGHLYAAVYAKEQGVSFLTGINTCSAFVEGWAMYAELRILQSMSYVCQDEALSLYCDYLYYSTIVGYVAPVIYDIAINYNGASVRELMDVFDLTEEKAQELIVDFMEEPTAYVSYGYGLIYMLNIHDYAMKKLKDKYVEVEFNAALLSEGMGPTLARADQIVDEYIASKL